MLRKRDGALMGMAKNKGPSWSDVKAELAGHDRAALLQLVKSLYTASKPNKDFIHARLDLGADPLAPYKSEISHWINPDIMKNQPISIAKAKKAITDYKKALGKSEGLAELSVFYCEEVFSFLDGCSMDDEGYFMSLERVYAQALDFVSMLSGEQQSGYMKRLDDLRERSTHIGWGVSDTFDELWFDAGFGEEN